MGEMVEACDDDAAFNAVVTKMALWHKKDLDITVEQFKVGIY